MTDYGNDGGGGGGGVNDSDDYDDKYCVYQTFNSTKARS
jgi:hypothetical protein